MTDTRRRRLRTDYPYPSCWLHVDEGGTTGKAMPDLPRTRGQSNQTVRRRRYWRRLLALHWPAVSRRRGFTEKTRARFRACLDGEPGCGRWTQQLREYAVALWHCHLSEVMERRMPPDVVDDLTRRPYGL